MNESTSAQHESLRRRLLMRICALTFALCFILTATLTSYAYGLLGYQKEHGKETLKLNIDTSGYLPSTPEGEEGEDVDYSHLRYNNNLFCVLFIGVDTNESRIKNNKGYQSDVLMLIVTDLDTNKSTLLSIPRDTLTEVNKLNAKGEITGKRYTKINAAFSEGGGMKKFSCENACAAVSHLLNIPVMNYIAIDMDGIAPLTDAIGGIDLKMDADFSKWGMPNGSMQHLDGKKAAIYVRQRKGVGTGGSDIERTKRQLRFVNAYINKLKELNPVTVLANNYSSMMKYVHTDISYMNLYSYATVASKVDFSSAEKISLPGRGDSNGNWVIDKDELGKIRNRVFFQ